MSIELLQKERAIRAGLESDIAQARALLDPLLPQGETFDGIVAAAGRVAELHCSVLRESRQAHDQLAAREFALLLLRNECDRKIERIRGTENERDAHSARARESESQRDAAFRDRDEAIAVLEALRAELPAEWSNELDEDGEEAEIPVNAVSVTRRAVALLKRLRSDADIQRELAQCAARDAEDRSSRLLQDIRAAMTRTEEELGRGLVMAGAADGIGDTAAKAARVVDALCAALAAQASAEAERDAALSDETMVYLSLRRSHNAVDAKLRAAVPRGIPDPVTDCRSTEQLADEVIADRNAALASLATVQSELKELHEEWRAEAKRCTEMTERSRLLALDRDGVDCELAKVAGELRSMETLRDAERAKAQEAKREVDRLRSQISTAVGWLEELLPEGAPPWKHWGGVGHTGEPGQVDIGELAENVHNAINSLIESSLPGLPSSGYARVLALSMAFDSASATARRVESAESKLQHLATDVAAALAAAVSRG